MIKSFGLIRLSLRDKTIFGIVLIEVVLLAALVWGMLNILSTTSATELGKRVQTTGQLFTATTKEALLSSDLATLKTVVQEVVANPGIVYARVVGRDDAVLAEAGDTVVPAQAIVPDSSLNEVDDGVYDTGFQIEAGGITYGTIHLGFSVAEIAAAIAEARNRGLAMAGLLVGASALLAFVLGFYLTRAVNDLGLGARMITDGCLGYQIPVRGRDELAEAVTAFNSMSTKLAEFANDQQHAQARLSYLADHDALTGLMNRRRFHEELNNWIQRTTRFKRPLSVLFIDLDEFKYVNDTFGHTTGDRFLANVASLLKNQMRDIDYVSRLGGDEFGVLLTETNSEQALAVATRVINKLSAADFEIEGQLIHTTASIGIAVCPDHGHDVETLLTKADIAMYRAKQRGRNRVHVSSESDTQLDRMKATIRWEDRIKRALKENRFHLVYQPIIALSGLAHESYEALLRMEDLDGQWVTPLAFLDTAERFGLIEDIDRRVVQMACNTHSEAKRAGREIDLSINLSAYEFNNPAMCDHIKETIEGAGVDPRRLIFEITETSALVNVAETESFMRRLTAMGCRFALDDFGAGFTSLSYLKDMPVDIIKIDGGFVRHMDQNPRDQALVRAVTEMAHSMGMKVTAECVENADTLSLLKQLNVDHAQGYFVGRPNALQFNALREKHLAS